MSFMIDGQQNYSNGQIHINVVNTQPEDFQNSNFYDYEQIESQGTIELQIEEDTPQFRDMYESDERNKKYQFI
ncbi:unnamed protein product [Paramecium sonneborni]|uniref:Uncharacterized protein n=1 Tax=Paramecium sonneborni TaxID=65129 RepID=A0A8S1MYL7_9CILI|nr:unnamed protein product [Paramecium sonneborni]